MWSNRKVLVQMPLNTWPGSVTQPCWLWGSQYNRLYTKIKWSGTSHDTDPYHSFYQAFKTMLHEPRKNLRWSYLGQLLAHITKSSIVDVMGVLDSIFANQDLSSRYSWAGNFLLAPLRGQNIMWFFSNYKVSPF